MCRAAIELDVSAKLEINTPRLLLRPVEGTDAEALWPFVSDPNLPRLMDWDPHRHISETKSFLTAMKEARERGSDIAWAIVHGQQRVGMIGLHGITRVLRSWRVERAELGYWIGPPHQGQGFVTEAAREVLRFGFEELGLHKIVVNSVDENAASRRVIEKLGFRLVGERRDDVFRAERWWNMLTYELLRADWRAR